MKLDELKVPFQMDRAIKLDFANEKMKQSMETKSDSFVGISHESYEATMQTVIGLRVEAAHAMGMLKGYRIAMKDLIHKRIPEIDLGDVEMSFKTNCIKFNEEGI